MAQSIAQDAQSQVVASPNEAGLELQALAKQQQDLTVTSQAISSNIAGKVPDGVVAQSIALTVAAQQIVLQATPVPPVSVKEVSVTK